MEQEETVLAIAEEDMSKTHALAVLLDNTKAVLDVNKCIPQQVIIDTGAVCIMMSKRYAIAVGVNLVEKAINNSLRTRFEQFSLDFVIREVI